MRILKLIRSFRKINKDYYKYAFIEIFLIIIGILIALEVNNANENRKLKLEEKKTLLAFHNEVSSSLLNLNLVLDKKRGIVNSDREILKYTGPNGRWNSEFKLDSLNNEEVTKLSKTINLLKSLSESLNILEVNYSEKGFQIKCLFNNDAEESIFVNQQNRFNYNLEIVDSKTTQLGKITTISYEL